MNEQKQDRTQTAINEAFGAEHGGDFTFELGEKNIFLAKPTPEECELGVRVAVERQMHLSQYGYDKIDLQTIA